VGLSISWIAFGGKSKDAALALLELTDSGEIVVAYEAAVSGATLPNGWYVAFFADYDFVSPARLAKFSVGCELVACQIEEHVMASTAYVFNDGRELFFVHHQGDEEEVRDLTTRGDPPPIYSSIRERLFADQDTEGDTAGVDYVFDIPVDLAKAICGYRHDEGVFDGGGPQFTRLTRK
jgi:hypothetical protein